MLWVTKVNLQGHQNQYDSSPWERGKYRKLRGLVLLFSY